MALFPGPPGWAGARRELLDFMVQRKINRGRHTDHPAGRHSIRTNQCPSPPSPIYIIFQKSKALTSAWITQQTSEDFNKFFCVYQWRNPQSFVHHPVLTLHRYDEQNFLIGKKVSFLAYNQSGSIVTIFLHNSACMAEWHGRKLEIFIEFHSALDSLSAVQIH